MQSKASVKKKQPVDNPKFAGGLARKNTYRRGISKEHKALDPLKELMREQHQKRKAQGRSNSVNTNQKSGRTSNSIQQRPKNVTQKTIRQVKKTQVSLMAMALRVFFIKSLKQFLRSGKIRSKYLYKFDIVDVISPKCYVILPKTRSVQSRSPTHEKFIFKQLHTSSVEIFCGTQTPTPQQVNSIIDPWINLVPKTPYIVNAYEVYRDYDLFMQMIEFCDGYDNVYSRLKKFNMSMTDSIPQKLIRMVYLFMIQMSHAFSIAHAANLTHGQFDLTQSICDPSAQTYKITNFRPWLAKGKKYHLLETDQDTMNEMTHEQKMRIAKSRDLFSFGCALYDLMLNKQSASERIKQKVVLYDDQQTREGSSTTPMVVEREQTKQEMQQEKANIERQIMPLMETIPLAWVQIIEGAPVIDILHQCMVIDSKRDTVALFNRINRQATEHYIRFFDSAFKPLPQTSMISEDFMNYFVMAAINNRAVMSQFKIMSHQLGRNISEPDNQMILDFQEKMFALCIEKDSQCLEANINMILLLWKRGKLFDDQVCDEIDKRVQDKSTAQLLILAFRKVNKYAVDQSWEQQVLKKETNDPVGEQIKMYLKEQSDSYKMADLGNDLWSKHKLVNTQAHISQLIPPTVVKSNLTPLSPHKKDQKDELLDKSEGGKTDVKKIFFSKNEKFIVMITVTHAIVMKINVAKFEPLFEVELPRTIDYKTADDKMLKEIALLEKSAKKLDMLKNPPPCLEQVAKFDLKQVIMQEVAPNQQQVKKCQFPSSFSALSAPSPDLSQDDGGDATTDDGGMARRKKTVKRIIVDDTSEKAEERRQQRERECIGGGFCNSTWLAAIDNAGETLVLHTSDSVQLVAIKEYFDTDLSRIQESNPQADDQGSYRSSVDENNQLVSILHVYSGVAFNEHAKLQIGHLCPEEILDLELDFEESNDDFGDGCQDSQSIMMMRESVESFEAIKVKEQKIKLSYEIAKKGSIQQFSHVISDSPSPRFVSNNNSNGESDSIRKIQTNANPSASTVPKMSQVELQLGLRQHSETQVPHSTFANSAAIHAKESPIKYAENLRPDPSLEDEISMLDKDTIDIKNLTLLKASQINNSTEEIEGMQIGGSVLYDDPKGSLLPGSQIQSPHGSDYGVVYAAQFGFNKSVNVKCKNLLSYNLLFAMNRTQLTDDVPLVVLQKEPEKLPSGTAIPTSFFRDPHPQKLLEKLQKRGANLDEATLRGFKALHFEHMREWVQQQELVGNIIKFSLYNSKYCVGFQRSTYNGLKPHFFVYEILKRKVVRRFLPIIDTFKSEWMDSDPNYFLKNENTKKSLDNDSDLDHTTASQIEEEDAEDVSVFELSPQGSYIVSLVSGELLTLKFLNRSVSSSLRKMLNPSFMIEEHVEMTLDLDETIAKDLQSYESKVSINNAKMIRFEKKDENVYVLTADRLNSSFNSSEGPPQNIAQQLVDAFTSYDEYVGSAYYKHVRLYKWYQMLMQAFKDPTALIYPASVGGNNQSSTGSLISTSYMNSHSKSGKEKKVKESSQLMPKMFRKVLQAIKEYNLTYSMITPQTQMLSGNIITSNNFSKKSGVTAIKKLCMFDQIVFGRPDDKIKKLIFSSFPRNFFVAVYFRRTLQVYDQITGQQIFELVCPSARNISFIDSENLLIVQEGLSQVFICAVNSQRQAFLNKELHVKRGQDLQVQQYEENQQVSAYTIGISAQRSKNQQIAKFSDDSEDSNQEEGTIGIKIITFDETIKTMVTSRSVCPFGYLALIGETKLAIYLTYAEEDSCTYDLIWTVNFSEMRKLGIGKRIELIDFSPNCEELVAVSNTGEVSLWSLKKQKFLRKVTTLKMHRQTPISQIRSFKNNTKCVMYSQPNNLLLLLDIESLNERLVLRTDLDQKIKQIRPESEGFGKLLSMQVDVSEQFLICTFSNNKVGIFSTQSGLIQLLSEEMSMICEGSYIDETGCFISMLDESKTKANIYAIEWKYNVDQPPDRVKKMSTIESFDAVSEKGEKSFAAEHGGYVGNNHVKIDKSYQRRGHRSILPQKRRPGSNRSLMAAANAGKAQAAAKDVKVDAPKSRACTIF